MPLMFIFSLVWVFFKGLMLMAFGDELPNQ